jgi:hypothetical protein
MSPEYVRPYVKAQNNHDRVAEAIAEAASTTWLSIPSDRSTRWIQKTSRPVSWMTIIGKSRPVRAAALRLSSANRRSSPEHLARRNRVLGHLLPTPRRQGRDQPGSA